MFDWMGGYNPQNIAAGIVLLVFLLLGFWGFSVAASKEGKRETDRASPDSDARQPDKS